MPCLTCFLLLAPVLPCIAAGPADDIRRVLADQQAAWNRGDLDAFMTGYEDSAETTFIGKSLVKGYASVLENYRKRYSDRAAMGTLEFSEVEVKLLEPSSAVVTGRFHLTRTAAAGGDAAGIFSLVFQKKASAWKIVLDHTS